MGHHEKVLVCSLGSIGQKYVNLIRKNWPEIKIGVLRSGKTSKVINGVDEYFFDDSDALDWNPQSVIIGSPAIDHIRQAIFFTSHKIPVLIEKPLGNGQESRESLEAIACLSESTPAFVGYILRQNPGVAIVKKMLSTHQIGKVISARFYCGSWLPDWRTNQDYRTTVSSRAELGGGALLELSHEIDLAYLLFDTMKIHFSELSKVSTLDINVEDQVIIVGRDMNKSLITIELDFCTQVSERSVCIRGSSGCIHWDLLNGFVNLKKEGCQTKTVFCKINIEDMFKKQLEKFWGIKHDSGEINLCTVKEGIKILRATNSIKFSQMDGSIL